MNIAYRLMGVIGSSAPPVQQYQEVTATRTVGNSTWTVPAGVTTIKKIVCCGMGGKGGNGNGVGTIPSGGGGGGRATVNTPITVTPGQVIYFRVPTAASSIGLSAYVGPAAGVAWCEASSGTAANVGVKGTGGTGLVGDVLESGADGFQGTNSPNSNKGGSSPEAVGGDGAIYNSSTFTYSNPQAGGTPGGGGGGGRPGSTSYQGGNGGRGEVRITYLMPI